VFGDGGSSELDLERATVVGSTKFLYHVDDRLSYHVAHRSQGGSKEAHNASATLPCSTDGEDPLPMLLHR
jgi:hypothetical protein